MQNVQKITALTVETAGGGRISVKWFDGDRIDYSFLAKAEGDVITEILPSSSHHLGAAVRYRSREVIANRRDVKTLSANAPEIEQTVKEVCRIVRDMHMITAARAATQARLEQREAEERAQKVETMRALMIKHGIAGYTSASDDVLVAFCDDVQGSCI